MGDVLSSLGSFLEHFKESLPPGHRGQVGAKAATPPRTTSGLQSQISRRDHQGEKKRLHVTPEEWEQEEEHKGEGGRAVGKPAPIPPPYRGAGGTRAWRGYWYIVATQEDSPAAREPKCECQGDPRAAGREDKDRGFGAVLETPGS